MSHPVWDSQRLEKFSARELAAILRSNEFDLDDRTDMAGIFGINNPALLIDALAEGLPAVDEFAVDLIERARARFRIGAALLYEPLTARPLSPPATFRAIAALGQEAGVESILDRIERRAPTAEEQKAVRREKLRSGTRAIEVLQREIPISGGADLSTMEADGTWMLALDEHLPDGRRLATAAIISPKVSFHWARLDRDRTWSNRSSHRPPVIAEMSFGQARSLLDSLSATRRLRVYPVWDRLRDVPPEPLPRPVPGESLSPVDARALVIDESWQAWRPFQWKIKWAASSLDRASTSPEPGFPAIAEELQRLALADWRQAARQPRFASRLAQSFEFMALHMALREDHRASSVAAEGILVARKRPGPLVQALAERERWTRLWLDAPLPPSWRARMRAELESIARGIDSAVIDAAQARLEQSVRFRGASGWTPGLPGPDTLDFGGALADAMQDRRARTRPT